jgi:hypothetical protein
VKRNCFGSHALSMNQLFVRLAASGLFALGLGATALADNASIGLTGANSTNTITNRSLNSWYRKNLNQAEIANWNNQNAKSGNVWVAGNTNVGGGVASGWAANNNQTDNQVAFNNTDPASFSFGDGGGTATITDTGANSYNSISRSSSKRLSQTNDNSVTATNDNNQMARSGNVSVVGNTNVEGPVTSGNAGNKNATTNSFEITNQSPEFSSDGSGGTDTAQISDTGYGSNNRINDSNTNSFRSFKDNQIGITNDNMQSAHSGNVTVSGNTNVDGPVSSGNAYNTNTTTNMINISN